MAPFALMKLGPPWDLRLGWVGLGLLPDLQIWGSSSTATP